MQEGKQRRLLSQLKQSWDSAIAMAVAQDAVSGDSLADAVASAAAVAAAATEGQNSSHMASLLLAADQRKGGDGKEEDNIQSFEV